jgi:hypothetical protein
MFVYPAILIGKYCWLSPSICNCQALQVFTHRLAQLAPAPLIPSSPAAPAAQRRREGLRMLQPGEKVEVGEWMVDLFGGFITGWTRMGGSNIGLKKYAKGMSD